MAPKTNGASLDTLTPNHKDLKQHKITKKAAPAFPIEDFTGNGRDNWQENNSQGSESSTDESENPFTSLWATFLLTKEPDDIQPFIKIGQIPISTPGNHALIIGKKKSRKTLFKIYLLSLYCGDLEKDALICDTEQGAKHVWKTKERLRKLTGKNVKVLMLRGLSPEERRLVIEAAVAELKPKIIVIDGIRDLLSNINDPDQSTELITFIESLTTTYNLHIVNVLHMNKTDNNARGHLGTELLNKAEITIELELDEKANATVVKCESSRDVPFESFAFTHNADELPELVSIPSKGEAMTDLERKLRLHHVFEDQALKRARVIDGIKDHFKVGGNKAGALLAEFLRCGWVVKNGKDHHPDTVYKLMAKI